MEVPSSLWIIFNAVVAVILFVDLYVFNKKAHKIGFREAVIWSVVCIAIALIFGGVVWWLLGSKPGIEYFTGFVVEKSLSVDNLFVFAVLFGYFGVPPQFQHRVLFWGIFGAILMRAAMIFGGVALINEFHWLLYVFGAFLIFTGVRMFKHDQDEAPDLADNRLLKALRRALPVTLGYHEQKFFVRIEKKLFVTPLFLVLIMIEISDVIFALDSIPAILGITRNTFIVYSSNIMAIIGLRALYFVLADVIDRFKYLHYGLSIVLIFIGMKMIVEVFHIEIPVWASLLFIFAVLAGSIIYSLHATEHEPPQDPEDTGINLPPPLDFTAPGGNGTPTKRVKRP